MSTGLLSTLYVDDSLRYRRNACPVSKGFAASLTVNADDGHHVLGIHSQSPAELDRLADELHALARDLRAVIAQTPAPAEPPPVEQADGHLDPLPPVAGPGEPELSERAAGALADFMVDDLQLRGVR